MKVASFTVRADTRQSARWKQAAEAEGFASVGSWAGSALDAYLKHRAKAGLPIPLAWHRGRFSVLGEDGKEVAVSGFVSRPFGAFRGTPERLDRWAEQYSLVHLPTRRFIASLKTYQQCKALASELAPVLIRDEQAGASIVDRHVREQA